MHRGKRDLLLAAAVIALLPAPAFAADDEASDGAQSAKAAGSASETKADGVEEIMVTARRVDESQQDAPVAVTALGGKMLDQLSAADTIDLSGRAPNVQVVQTGAGASSASIFIRGIGNNALGFNVSNPVGVYVDDVYIPRLQGSLTDLLDLQRVEILRGPQGTLYGRDSTVGAVKYVSKDPDLYDTHLRARAVLGNYDRRDVLAGASVPIIPGKLAVKVDVSSRDQKGYIIGVDADGNPDGQRANGIDRQAGRVSVLWTPDDRWRIRFSADITNDDSGSTVPTRILAEDGSTCDPSVGECVYAWDSPYKTGINTTPAGYADTWGGSLNVEYDAGFATIKSITAYRELESLDVIDQTRLPGQGILLKDAKDQNQFSQELQLASNASGPLSWVGGLLYFRESVGHIANLYTTHRNDDRLIADSYAAFANASYELFDGFHVEAGGRVSREERWIERAVLPYSGSSTPLLEGDASFSESKFTYKLGADYAITSDVMIYYNHATGYRPGSFGSTYASPVVEQVVFGHTNAETAENDEIGLKSEWFDGKLRANVAAFDTTYKNMQTQSTKEPYNVTATDFRFKGVEVELEARPVRDLTLFASGGYLDADTLSGSNEGKRPRLTPKFQFSVGGEYRKYVGNGIEVFVNANDVYTSKYTTDPSNVSSATQNAYHLLGASIGADFEDGKYTVSVSGKNLTDSVYFNGTSLNKAKYVGAPRTVFVTFEVSL